VGPTHPCQYRLKVPDSSDDPEARCSRAPEAALNVVVADEQSLECLEGLTDEITAQIGLHVYRCQNSWTIANQQRPLTPATLPPTICVSSRAVDRLEESAVEVDKVFQKT
jgi:hypothetical protein